MTEHEKNVAEALVEALDCIYGSIADIEKLNAEDRNMIISGSLMLIEVKKRLLNEK